MSKYGAKKTEIDGVTFDSQKEANRYLVIKDGVKHGRIKWMVLQPKFELLPPFEKNGKKERGIYYIADFMYYDNYKRKVIIEDVKGFKTDVYKLKRKLFEAKYKRHTIDEI